MTLVLVIDDVPAMTSLYEYDLRRLGQYAVHVAHSGREGLDALLQDDVDCVILDLEMPGMDGFAVLREMAKRGGGPPVIVYTGTGDFDRCVQAMRLGADGFVDKNEPIERVVHEVETVLKLRSLREQVAAMQRRDRAESALVGGSPPMRALQDAIARLARIPSPVLLLGESGSGKDIVARELHLAGSDPKAPFLAVNCAALPDHLVESELFGHERGAFTGAVTTRKGAFEAAGKGTLFLDEIGELPLAAQAKLLRVLEAHTVTRVGASGTIPVTARVITATNRDLDSEVSTGRFREDLLYRLNVHVIRVPPLRERLSDLPELAERFVAAICARFGRRVKTLEPTALAALMRYEWRRNNVRELRNVIERMIIATDGETIGVEQLPAELRPEAGFRETVSEAEPQSYRALREEAERRIVVEALERHGWHLTRTASALGLADHASLSKIMKRLDVRRA
ncbi:MAG: sigma-54-dependent Fis family transcriptional regulator [Gemmatimonadales bacterium]|nr:sigma-54-dependent Fis family transcriptional regulator [Gemmatimonadales bacterium]